MPYNIDVSETVIFNRYFAGIDASTSKFQAAILPLLNSDWDKNSELLITKLQSFADRLENDTYRECIDATKDYINSRDFIAPNKYETTSYFYDALQYTSESPALKNLNQKLDQLMQDIPQKNISWSESFENLWCKTVSTLFSAFDFAKDNPIATTAALLYGQVALASAFPAVFNLSSLDGANGFKINGEVDGDFSGFSVSFAGDVNGDGYGDLIIGVPYASPGGISSAGSTYIVFGKASGWASIFDLASLNGTNGFKINGESEGDISGWSVSSAGDVNGDGYDDIVIAAWGGGITSNGGKVYVVFGKGEKWLSPLELSSLNGANGFKMYGEAGSWQGKVVSSAGDINGDGYDDVIIGAYGAYVGNQVHAGKGYVVFGKASNFTSSFSLSSLNGMNGFKMNGIMSSDYTGWSVSSVGDINDDGFDDVIIGAYGADNDDVNVGISYIVFGKNTSFAESLDLSSIDGSNGFKIVGKEASDRTGYSVSSAGDINGDGYDDVIIGSAMKKVYVVFGKPNDFISFLDLSILNGTNGFMIQGGQNYNRFVSSAGDINGDGYDDLIIGNPDADSDGKNEAGESYVIFGKAIDWESIFELSSLDGSNGFKIAGEKINDVSGYSVSSAGDINGDGFDDLIIGAPAYYNGYMSIPAVGASYVIFGHRGDVLQVTTNKLEIENRVTLLTNDKVSQDDKLIFNVSNLENGQFELMTVPGIPIFNFTQQQLKTEQVRFIQPTPKYNITVSNGRNFSETSEVQVSFKIYPVNNTSPVLLKNELMIVQNQSFVLSTKELLAYDKETDINEIIFMLSDVRHGKFTTQMRPDIMLTGFTQNQIINSEIQFIHDGSQNAPAYNITINDGYISNGSYKASVNFKINTPPDNNTSSVPPSLKSEENLTPVQAGMLGGAIGGIVLGFVTFMVMKYLKSCTSVEDVQKGKTQIVEAVELQPLSKANVEEKFNRENDPISAFNHAVDLSYSNALNVSSADEKRFPLAGLTFFQSGRENEQKNAVPKFYWQQTNFDEEFVQQVKDMILEPRYMCPVLARPMYDAVYIKVRGDDKLLAISDEAVRIWLVKKQQTTCPKRNLPVEAVFIASDLREIIKDAVEAQLNQLAQPPAYAEIM